MTSFADLFSLSDHEHPIKSESEQSASPELLPASLSRFSFQLQPDRLIRPVAHDNKLQPDSNPSAGGDLQPLYRFGSETAGLNSMANPSSWPPPSESLLNGHRFDFGGVQNTIPFNDEYDDISEMVELPEGATLGLGPSSGLGHEKTVRRRSSKGASGGALMFPMALMVLLKLATNVGNQNVNVNEPGWAILVRAVQR
jgi:hypothetical protein